MTITATILGHNKITKELETNILSAVGNNYLYLEATKGTIKVTGKDFTTVELLQDAGIGVYDITYTLNDPDFRSLMDNL